MTDHELLIQISKSLDNVNAKISTMEAKMDTMEKKIEKIQEDVEDLKEGQERLTYCVNGILEWTEKVSNANAFPLPHII